MPVVPGPREVGQHVGDGIVLVILQRVPHGYSRPALIVKLVRYDSYRRSASTPCRQLAAHHLEPPVVVGDDERNAHRLGLANSGEEVLRGVEVE